MEKEASSSTFSGVALGLAGCALVAWIILAFYTQQRLWFIIWEIIFGALTMVTAASLGSGATQAEIPENQEKSSETTEYKIAGAIWVVGSAIAWELWRNRVIEAIFH